ncbi:MAG: hypothetical protein XE12_1538, partial [Synergistales bacterium 54_9]
MAKNSVKPTKKVTHFFVEESYFIFELVK